jgi:hypothetical protein
MRGPWRPLNVVLRGRCGAMIASSHLRKVLLGSCVLIGVGFFGFVLVQHAECSVGTIAITHPSLDTIESEKQALHDIAIAGIKPSADARVLFEEFAKRFSLIAATSKRERPYNLRSIIKSGGGDRDELAFVLLTLFEWNGIDAESVEVYGSPEAVRKRNVGEIQRVLVYLPDQDRVFDPILPAAEQHKESGRAVVGRMPRIHYASRVLTSYECRGVRS